MLKWNLDMIINEYELEECLEWCVKNGINVKCVNEEVGRGLVGLECGGGYDGNEVGKVEDKGIECGWEVNFWE